MTHILVVDDQIDILEVITDYLRNNNYRADGAEDGLQALKRIKENKYSLIITDLMMPKKSGFDLLEEIRVSHKDIPVLVITGGSNFAEHENKLRELKKDNLMILKKPFSKDELLNAVKTMLRK